MNGSNHYKEIEDSIKRLRRKTDEQLDKRILEDTLATFAEEMPRRTGWQLFFSSKITRIAAAAVILVVIVIVAQKYVAVKKGPAEGESIIPAAKENKTAAIEEAGKTDLSVESAETTAGQDSAKLEEELKQIVPLISANDANGLAKMLANAGAESRLAAIVYLANMGNQRSVEILDKLSAGLGTNEPNNIFAVTSAVLKKRLVGKAVDSNKPELAEKKTKKYKFVPRGVLSGLVTDANTALPVANAAVKLLNPPPADSANSDANGFYFFDRVEHPGDYNIAVLSKEYIGEVSAIRITQENLSGRPASGGLVADFRLEKACMLELMVDSEANEPVPGAEVFVTSDAENNKIIDTEFEQATDEKGVLLLGGLKKGRYNIIIIDRVPDMNDISRLVPAFAPQHTQVELENPLVPERRKITLTKGFEVNGLVRFAGGLPAADLKISAMPAWWLLPFTIQDYTTDFEGRFTLEHITAGPYRIKVKKPSDADILTINAELPPHEQPLIITLPQDSNAPDPNVVSAQNPL